MALLQELGRIHDKLHTLLSRTGESAAKVVIPIVLAILHEYHKKVDSANSDMEALKEAVEHLRSGGKGALDASLSDFRGQHGSLSPTLKATLDTMFADVLGSALPPARLKALLDYIAAQESFLAEFNNEDFLGALFETLVSDAFRGDNGQFFTPKNIILIVREMMTLLLGHKNGKKPIQEYTICDPCCGSARFLIYWSERVLRQFEEDQRGATHARRRAHAKRELRKWAEQKLFAIDIEPKIASYACLNMLLHGDGSTNVATADALNHYGLFAHWPKLTAFAKEFVQNWPGFKAKYSARSDFDKPFAFIDSHKDVVSEAAQDKTTEIDLTDDKWIDLLQIVSELCRIQQNVSAAWPSLDRLHQVADFKSVHELMRSEWRSHNEAVARGFDLILTNPPFGRGGKNLQVNAENENERFILAQYKLATELWIWDASNEQLAATVLNNSLDVQTSTGTGRKQLWRDRSKMIPEIIEALSGREWLTVPDVLGRQGVGFASKVTFKNAENSAKHTIYFDLEGQPILFRRVMPKQILFLEQFLRMVKTGGRIFTVLDMGVLSNIDDEYVRRFLFRAAKVLAVVEFPHGAFKAAKADVRTAVVLLERTSKPSSDYPIFGSLPQYLGYDTHRRETPPIPENDLGRSVCDFSIYLGGKRFCKNGCPWETRRFCKFGDEIKMTRATDGVRRDVESDEEDAGDEAE